MSKKTAVILFNLGGPDNPDAVKPFLFNLFNDPAIINLKQPFRYLLAKIISESRERKAKAIYASIGNKSPIVEETKKQAEKLEKKLNTKQDGQYKTFMVMRYWHPRAEKVVKEVKNYQPDHIIFLPLYPQFSTTTTESSVKEFLYYYKKENINLNPKIIGCYPTHPAFIQAHIELLKPRYEKAKAFGNPKILFSAHGLPKKIIENGDPYQWQTEQTVQAIVKAMKLKEDEWIVSYQSKVGPLEWMGPDTETVIINTSREKRPIVVVPVSFVSEHSETRAELDIQYKKLAEEHKAVYYNRVPALSCSGLFIEALAELCTKEETQVICPEDKTKCYCRSKE